MRLVYGASLATTLLSFLAASAFAAGSAARPISDSIVSVLRAMPPTMAEPGIRFLLSPDDLDLGSLKLTRTADGPDKLDGSELTALKTWANVLDEPNADSKILFGRAQKLEWLANAVLRSPLHQDKKIRLITELGLVHRSLRARLFNRSDTLSKEMARLLSAGANQNAFEIAYHLVPGFGSLDVEAEKAQVPPAVNLARSAWASDRPQAATLFSRPGWHLMNWNHNTETNTWRGEPKHGIIRMGYFMENPSVPFRGNILYLEGLSDSMMNHDNLFQELSDAGYRVIAFDYMGQGGSSGSMDWTRLDDRAHPGTEIDSLADLAWDKLRRKDSSIIDRRIVLGWSTGGLDAYRRAHLGKTDAVILISPAVGGVKLLSPASIRASFHLRIEDLTHADYSKEPNPHTEPIVPSAPAKVPLFVLNLIRTAVESGFWKISDKIQGLALLSGKSDPLVNGKRTAKALARNAPHFRVVSFPDAAHEIHNEVRSIREAATREILAFLAGLG